MCRETWQIVEWVVSQFQKRFYILLLLIAGVVIIVINSMLVACTRILFFTHSAAVVAFVFFSSFLCAFPLCCTRIFLAKAYSYPGWKRKSCAHLLFNVGMLVSRHTQSITWFPSYRLQNDNGGFCLIGFFCFLEGIDVLLLFGGRPFIPSAFLCCCFFCMCMCLLLCHLFDH